MNDPSRDTLQDADVGDGAYSLSSLPREDLNV